MLLLTLDDSRAVPKFRQIMDQIQRKVETGELVPGERLPSTRRLADALGVHRSTVATAYQELWALGLLDLGPGSVPRIRERMRTGAASGPAEAGAIDWAALASPPANELRQVHLQRVATAIGTLPRPTSPNAAAAPLIDFSRLDMDERLFPIDSFRSCLNRVLRRHGERLLGYGDSAGHGPLRQWIARRLSDHGIAATPEQIVVTSGSQQALDLVLRMVARPGQAVAMESPTYDLVPPLLRFHDLRVLEIPIADDGMDLVRLAEVLERESPALVYTMPSFQNPTGVSTSQAHRERLLALCQDHRVPIFEDSFDEEMKYFGRAVLPIKSMDRRHTVIYSGTFSKVLFPGVRIGWAVAERECIERLIAIRRFSELSANLVMQAAMEEFCRQGYYDAHVSRMHRVFRRRMRATLQALRRLVPPEWATWTEPSGGYLIWLKLRPPGVSTAELGARLAAHGVRAALGQDFFASAPAAPYLRLSISRLDEAEVAVGIERLAAALASLYGRLPPEAGDAR